MCAHTFIALLSSKVHVAENSKIEIMIALLINCEAELKLKERYVLHFSYVLQCYWVNESRKHASETIRVKYYLYF